MARDCKFRTCKKCNKHHNSLLHLPEKTQLTQNYQTTHCSTSTNDETEMVSLEVIKDEDSSNILLATAVILVQDNKNNWRKCRALLDSASQANFVKESVLNKLGKQTVDGSCKVSGVNGCEIDIKGTVQSSENTIDLPSKPILQFKSWNIPQVDLADEEFYKKQEVELLIGAEVYFEILNLNQISLGPECPILQDTQFGWVISGKEHFLSTYKRDETGRFVVKLPKKTEPTLLGDSKTLATKRFLSLESRLSKNKQLYESYASFMKEYEDLGHMKQLEQPDEAVNTYYIPHQAVVKEDRVTIKLRVVFDASARRTTGLSLNDILLVGPTIQNELISILPRFRFYRFVMTADIIKMYRQIRMDDEDANLQRILWRASPNQNLTIYKLTTVAYGTSSAPYLAIRCLHELAKDSSAAEKIARTILNDFYVDDLITGSDSLQELIQLRDNLRKVLSSGGFELNKWSSNNKQVTINLSNSSSTQPLIIFDKNDTIKTLGLLFNAQDDVFKFHIDESTKTNVLTKRVILSDISKIFDPLGLLSPVVITAKIYIQQLWEAHIDWDGPVPKEIASSWKNYRLQLSESNELKIPRLVGGTQDIELHGFADASKAAYGACIYVHNRLTHQSNLLTAKGRVAPLHGYQSSPHRIGIRINN